MNKQMRWLKYQSLEDYDGGRGGREGRGRRPVQTGHYKANICLIQSLTETSGSASRRFLCTTGFAKGWHERRKL